MMTDILRHGNIPTAVFATNLLMKKVTEPEFKVFQNVNLRTTFVERDTIADVKKNP